MRKAILGAMVSAAMLGGCGSARGDIEEIVPMARPALYAELESRVAEIEAAAAKHPTETGNPPYPVNFRFAHDQDRHLLIHAQAAFREVSIELWLEDGADKQHTRLSSRLSGMSNDKIKPGDIRLPIETTLNRVLAELEDDVRVSALFGKL